MGIIRGGLSFFSVALASFVPCCSFEALAGLALEFKVCGLQPGQSYKLATSSVGPEGRVGSSDTEQVRTVPGHDENFLSATDKHNQLDLSQGGLVVARSGGPPSLRAVELAHVPR